ncbi:MAG: CheR family methyltransferase, partial [Archaeoglobaceae archaeon]
KDFVKRRVRFKKHDLTSQEPITKFLDAIFCRNVMIYFTEEQKTKVLRDFHNALVEGGYLIIGKSESIPAQGFECVSLTEKVYRKV